jgi:hypothetical protein
VYLRAALVAYTHWLDVLPEAPGSFQESERAACCVLLLHLHHAALLLAKTHYMVHVFVQVSTIR